MVVLHLCISDALPTCRLGAHQVMRSTQQAARQRTSELDRGSFGRRRGKLGRHGGELLRGMAPWQKRGHREGSPTVAGLQDLVVQLRNGLEADRHAVVAAAEHALHDAPVEAAPVLVQLARKHLYARRRVTVLQKYTYLGQVLAARSQVLLKSKRVQRLCQLLRSRCCSQRAVQSDPWLGVACSNCDARHQ